MGLIDTVAINGSARVVGWVARLTAWFQTGSLYQYAVVMMIAVFYLLSDSLGFVDRIRVVLQKLIA